MLPEIKIIKEKKLIGMFESMSLVENKTFKLFSTFMPRRKEIMGLKNMNVLDLRIFPKDYHVNFSPSNYFKKGALVEVSDIENVPDEMESFILKGGKYAVFKHKGLDTDSSIYQYIFTEWLPDSAYFLDDRPHFDVLGRKVKGQAPHSEQEIWIPVR